MAKKRTKRAFLLLGCVFLLSCADGGDGTGSSVTDETDAPAVDQIDAPPTDETDAPETDETDAPATQENVFTHKMMKQVPGRSQAEQFAYECRRCSFEQWLSIEPPPGWTKGPAQVSLMEGGDLRSRPSLEQVQAEWPEIQEEDFYESWDFLEEVPGNEYELIAVNLGIEALIQFLPNIVVRTQVMRDTELIFYANRRVHELTHGEGDVFVLFAYGVDPEDPVFPDFQDPDALGDFTPPAGWTYSTRVLEEELVLASEDKATVLAFRTKVGQNSTWEKR